MLVGVKKVLVIKKIEIIIHDTKRYMMGSLYIDGLIDVAKLILLQVDNNANPIAILIPFMAHPLFSKIQIGQYFYIFNSEKVNPGYILLLRLEDKQIYGNP